MTTTLNASTSSGFVMTPDNSGTVAIQSNGTTGLTVGSSGYVLTPTRPCFSGYKTDGSVTSAGVYTLNNMDTNVGSHYSTSTGRFTAPVAGVYSFVSNITSYNAITRVFSLRKNGTVVASGVVENSAGSGYYVSLPLNAVLTLTVGDYVDLYITSGGAYGSTSTDYRGFFSGFLIG